MSVSYRGGATAEAAVRDIYQVYYGRLAGWAASLVGDRDLGHDLATEAFVRLLHHVDSVSEPRAWLYTTTGNLVRDHWRKRGREAMAYAKVHHDRGALPADSASVLTVREAVLSLPDRLRMVVLLYYFADLPVAVVAQQLGKSTGAVKRDLYEARGRLASLLDGVR
ncbi:RNA polymerase sigma factor [Arsenicicoccus dermatophilus]|uniref:RNA polymerase sigma factor n=1 Tax=Arsenicicoccus dermatophilus TaxID=1076331 RepID=UPI001F4D31D2|nr:RNA polymerase sigma factor [Arsenicicoccus dermatophilus]MCH8614409.1 RNA polymerase sigma factor [Arsenicicoccus dermatophilus]